MPQIHFLTADGDQHVFNGPDGMSVMELAVANNVPGIDADCGGACACATCHVYVDEAWQEATGTPSFSTIAISTIWSADRSSISA